MIQPRIQKAILSLILASPFLLTGIPMLPHSPSYEVPTVQKPADHVPYHMHPGRTYIDLNGIWRFRLPGESKWKEVVVPHTYNKFAGLEEYVGPVEYQKEFQIDDIPTHCFLHFLGVRNKVRVLINGAEAGTHETGYTSFSFDIAPLLHPGVNTIAATVDNSLDDDHPPNLIGWTNYGGITREVYIEQTGNVYISDVTMRSDLDSAGDPPAANVSVRARIRGANAGRVAFRLFSPSNDLVAEEVRGPINADEEVVSTFRINNPLLWNIGEGNLYRIEMLADTGESKDYVAYTFGARDIRIDDTSILLNDRPIYLKGTSRHEDFPELGCVETPEQMRQDLDLIMKAGFNTLRLAHYPYHPAFIEMCDRAGILAIEELPIWNATASIMSRPAYLENSLRMAEEMVSRDINHPSIIAWGIGNEVEASAPEGQAFLRKLKERIKALDPTRPVYTTFRKTNDAAGGEISDFLALNVKLGWYHGKATDLEPLLEKWHREFPDKPIVMTEHSAGTTPGYRSRRFLKWSEDYQAYLLQYYFKVLHAKPYVAGDFVWPLFDYPDPAKVVNPVPFFNVKGIVTFDRKPKLAYHLMSQLNADEEPDTDYVALYENRPSSFIPGRFFWPKIMVLVAAIAAAAAFFLGKKRIFRLLVIGVFFSTSGILLREFTLDTALNPAMFEGAINHWISATLRPLACIPFTLLYCAMIPLSASVLLLCGKSEKQPFDLLAASADGMWPAIGIPLAFFFAPVYWIGLAACAASVFLKLKQSSGRSGVRTLLSIVIPMLILLGLLLAALQWRYEFLTFLFGFLFHGM